MKCPKCKRYIEEGSEAHALCGWNVVPKRAAPIEPTIDHAAVQRDLERLGIARREGQSESEHVAEVKRFIKKSLTAQHSRRGSRAWAVALREKYERGEPLTLAQKQMVEKALNCVLVREDAEPYFQSF